MGSKKISDEQLSVIENKLNKALVIVILFIIGMIVTIVLDYITKGYCLLESQIAMGIYCAVMFKDRVFEILNL